jgi:hypothetical protein
VRTHRMALSSCATFALVLIATGCANGSNAGNQGGSSDAGQGNHDAASNAIDGSVDATLDAHSTLDGATNADANAIEGGALGDDASDPISATLIGDDVPNSRVGMFYLVWHAAAATAQAAIQAEGGTPLTVEDVIRSNGALTLSDIYEKWGLESTAYSLYYQTHPNLGFYCIYRARPNETGIVPDCPNITTTLTTHAAELIAANVDYVVVDETNLTDMSPEGDLLQLRPTEVLFEEWAALRAAGKKTPQIAVWNAVPTGSTQWQGHLALYANPAYDSMVMRDKKTGKKIFFVVDSGDSRAPDPAILQQIESDNGANDIVIQRMWIIGTTDPTVDRWTFEAPCETEAGAATTTTVGIAACQQPYMPVTTLGSAVAVSPSYQTNYGSLAWGAAGKMSGLAFRQQWATALNVMPNYVFVSGWNEFVASPFANPYIASDPYALDVGLERDPEGAKVFVDSYGADLSRDIEPSLDYGGTYYDLMASCARVYRHNAAMNLRGCSVPTESCCDPSSASAFSIIYALRNDGAKDSLLTTQPIEVNALVAGGGWREVCARTGTPTAFCLDANEPSTPFGPFVLYSQGGAGRAALYRCITTASAHFYSLDPACEGQRVEYALGYLQTTPTGEFPRRVERCAATIGTETQIALGTGCPTGFNDRGLLGYAR